MSECHRTTEQLGVRGETVTVLESVSRPAPPREPKTYTFAELRELFSDGDNVILPLLDEIERLARANRILELKSSCSLANNLCPDHRDKQAFKSCLACEIERLEKRRE